MMRSKTRPRTTGTNVNDSSSVHPIFQRILADQQRQTAIMALARMDMAEQALDAANAAHLLLIDGDEDAAPFTWLPLGEVTR